MSNKYLEFGKKMPGFVFQEILKHILQNPAYTIMHGAVAVGKKNAHYFSSFVTIFCNLKNFVFRMVVKFAK